MRGQIPTSNRGEPVVGFGAGFAVMRFVLFLLHLFLLIAL
jgi:hypothetical protein